MQIYTILADTCPGNAVIEDFGRNPLILLDYDCKGQLLVCKTSTYLEGLGGVEGG